MNPNATVQKLVDDISAELKMSRFEAARQVRGLADMIVDEERQNRIAELRKRIDERKDAEKELAALKPVGAPRKPRRKRKDLEALVTA